MRHALLVALLLSTPAWSQEGGVKMEPKYAPGDKAAVATESTIDLEISSKDGEAEKHRALSTSRQESFTQEVAEVASGRPRLLRIKCTKATIRKSGSNLSPVELTGAMEGQTYQVTPSDSSPVKTLTGDPAPVEAEMLGSWEELVRLLPGDAKKIGDSWTIDAKDAGAAVWMANLAGTAGTLQCSLTNHEGSKATISFKGSVTGTTRENFKVALELSGEYVFDTATGKSVSYTASGSLQMEKKVTERIQKPDSYDAEIVEIGWISVKSKELKAKVTFQ